MNTSALLAAAVSLTACGGPSPEEKRIAQDRTPTDTVATAGRPVVLPAPYVTESATRRSKVIDWPAGQVPVAPAGFPGPRETQNRAFGRRDDE